MWLCILIDVVPRWIRISFYQPIIQYCFSSSKALRIANIGANAGRFVVVCSGGYNQSSNWHVYSK